MSAWGNRAIRPPSPRPRLSLVLWGLAILATIPGRGLAGDRYWDAGGGPDADWSNPANWTGNVEPAEADNAYVGATSGGGVNPATANITEWYSARCLSLYLGYDAVSSGVIQLTHGQLRPALDEYVGYAGTGVFNNTEGANILSGPGDHRLYLGYSPGSHGTYNLEDWGSLAFEGGTTAYEYVGYSGTGVFNQTAGNNTISAGTSYGRLYLGYNAGASGAYNLSGGMLSGSIEYIGYSGAGEFTQTGGTNQMSGGDYYGPRFYLGYSAGASGTYNLSGGKLSAVTGYVGYSGTGAFNQTGGTNQLAGQLYLGANAGASGTYALSGTGQLIVQSVGSSSSGYEYVGFHGAGTFNQTGGTNAIRGVYKAYLYLGIDSGVGTYDLGGSGQLTIGSSACAGYLTIGASGGTGTFNQTGGTNTLFGTSSLWGGLSVGGTGGSGTYNLSGSGQLIVGFGGLGMEYVGSSGIGIFNQDGGTNTIYGTLCLGYATAANADGTYNLAAGSLSAQSETIGGTAYAPPYSSAGTFNQTGGTNAVSGSLRVGDYPASTGAYSLSGTGQLTVGAQANPVGVEYVGYSGTGTFNQAGGTHTVYGSLSVGYASSSTGTFNLSGGSLSTNSETVSAYGVFNQTGGTHTVSGQLNVSGSGTRSGVYNLGGTGTLSAGSEFVGSAGAATFNQTGGANTGTIIYLGYNSGSNGTYMLSGGSLSAGTEYIGYGYSGAATGTLTQTGGTNTVTRDLFLGVNSGNGTYVLSGGTNTVSGSITIASSTASTGTYNLTRGTLAVARGATNKVTVNGGGSSTAGGTLALGDAWGTGTITETGTGPGVGLAVNVATVKAGVVSGWGRVGLTGTLTNNGRIVADGYQTDRTLALSSFTSVTNTSDNPTTGGTRGWFAVNRGKLTLPAINVAVNPVAVSYNWGESSTATTIDLVNSARITLNSVTASGPMSISLLSPDHMDAPSGTTGQIIGMWQFTPPPGFTFSTANLTFRYDDALAAALGLNESLLRVYSYNAGAWADVTIVGPPVDTANNRITTTGMKVLTTFAVGTGISIPNQWKGPAGWNYNDPANWTANSVPNGTGAAANFLDGVGASATITVTSPVSVDAINFSKADNCTIAGPAPITLSATSGNARVKVLANNLLISAQLNLASNTDFTVAAGKTLRLWSVTGPGGVIKTGGGRLNWEAGGYPVSSRPLTICEGEVSAVGSTPYFSALTIGQGATYSTSLSQSVGSIAGEGFVTLSPGPFGTPALDSGRDNSSTAFSGVISGTGHVRKIGTGTWTLSGANTYSGATGILYGTLRAGAANVIPALSPVTVLAFGTFELGDFDQTVGSIQGDGHIDLGTAALTVGGDNTSTTFAGLISNCYDGSLLKTGAGTLTLSGQNTYTGPTIVSSGVLRAGASNTIPSTSAVWVDSQLDLSNYNQAVGSIAGGGEIRLGGATLTTGYDNTSTTFSGRFDAGGSLVKLGTGTLTLTPPPWVGNSLQSAAVTGGAISVSSANALGRGPITLDGGALQVTAGILIGAPISLGSNGGTIDVTDGNQVTARGELSGPGGLTKTGAGVLRLEREVSNTYAGPTIVSQGVLEVYASGYGYGNPIPITSAVTVAGGATLRLLGSTSVGSIAGDGHIELGYYSLEVGYDNTSTTFAGTISNCFGQLVKTGAGTLTLTGANTHQNGTGVLEGVLSVSADSNLGIGPVYLTGGTLRITGSSAFITNKPFYVVNAVESTLEIANPAGVTLLGTLDNSEGRQLLKTGVGPLTIAGPQAHGAGAALVADSGTVNLNSDAGNSKYKTLRVTANNAAAVHLNVTQHLAALNVNDTSTIDLPAGGGKVLVVKALTMEQDGGSFTGRLDLADNRMIVDYLVGASPIGEVNAMLRSGFLGGWAGTGIVSSVADDNPSLYAIGMLDQGMEGAFVRETFGGEPVDITSVLLRYTYLGDTNLDGVVDGTDFSIVANSVNMGLPVLWQNGDFNYDGLIDGTDFSLLANSFNMGGQAPLGAMLGGEQFGGKIVAVPEPGSALLLAAGGLLGAWWKRRRR